jgi:streptomycin 6-kinase
VLLHQDLHGWNVLAAQREPWLVIDPKPLVGEREFGLAPTIRSQEMGAGRREALRRLDRLTSELGLDRERARQWCIAQTVAWSVGEGDDASHLAVAEWLLDG